MTHQDSVLRYDPSGTFLGEQGISPEQLQKLAPHLEEARRVVTVEDPAQVADPASIPPDKLPLDAGFYALPEQILGQYRTERDASELGRMIRTASALADTVDRVVLLGIGGSYMGARALMDACCEPYFNELDRGRRGGRPRLYFQGNNLDNDATQGLLSLLLGPAPPGRRADVDDQWAIVVTSKSGGTLETAVAFRQFVAALRDACGGDSDKLARRVIPVTGRSGKLRRWAEELRCPAVFDVPDAVGGRFSVLSAVGLLPAAIVGIDVVELLEGAVAMNQHFRSAPVGDNVVLDYVGVCHLMENEHRATIRVLDVWSQALEAAGWWYDQLLAESLGKERAGATPVTAVNTRDLHSRAQQHQEGRLDKLHTNLIVDAWRHDPLRVGRSDLDPDDLNKHADKTLPDLMRAAIAGTNQAYRAGGRPTADLHLPAVTPFYLGQFFQMMMLATVVEGRLIGINPYGQPGVEAYKRNMIRILNASGQ